jgi:hypothetical protein
LGEGSGVCGVGGWAPCVGFSTSGVRVWRVIVHTCLCRKLCRRFRRLVARWEQEARGRKGVGVVRAEPGDEDVGGDELHVGGWVGEASP